MKVSEWLEISATIKERWPHSPVPDESLRRWGDDLADLPGEVVAAAVESLGRSEREFAPLPGIIRREAIRLTLDAPEWAEALSILRELAGLPPAVVRAFEEQPDESVRVVQDHPRQNAIAREHPLVGKFISLLGWDQIEPAVRDEASGSDEARLREKWYAFLSRLERDASLEGIEGPAALAALKPATRRHAPRRLGEALSQVAGEIGPGDKAA